MGQRLAGALAVIGLSVGAVMLSPSAMADPDPSPVDPASPPPPVSPIPPRAGIGSVLAQDGADPVGPLGLPDLSGYTPGLLLAQHLVPSAPGAPAPVTAPELNAFDEQYLLPQNVAPAAPGQGVTGVGIGPSADDPGTGRLAFLRRLHEMYSAGALSGALLGQVPDEQLGQPLPGTAPGPGIYVPSGLGPGTPAPAAPPAP
ncbi:hypothetical protein [Mycolicibacterium sp. CH28]|uniref:hypothetical protein n=1 Tax=Mycolicibacterium sp. CH28 TaxID=2512237 RepID=UPI001912F36F|nr:hypothetical protein [Mycolicibacterium sp. CH28]